MTDYEALSRAYDVYLIKNVMGRHAYHHSLGTHREELDELWSKRDDISWATPASLRGICAGCGTSIGCTVLRQSFWLSQCRLVGRRMLSLWKQSFPWNSGCGTSKLPGSIDGPRPS